MTSLSPINLLPFHFFLVASILIFGFTFFPHGQLFNLLALLLASLLPFYPFSNLSMASQPSSMASYPLNVYLTLVSPISPLLLLSSCFSINILCFPMGLGLLVSQ
jgi:hypothetical protein